MYLPSRILPLVCAGLLVGLSPPGGAIDDEAKQPVALAISGGASKGAYEAGLNWGLAEITRSTEEIPNWVLGGRTRDYEIVGIAGTSAGGINTLLTAMSWCVRREADGGFPNRIDDNVFRDSWLVPDINGLLPPDPGSPPYLPGDAALSREPLVRVARALREKWNTPGSFRAGCHIPLGVTVTRTKPEQIIVDRIEVGNQRFYIPFEFRVRPDGSADFFFDPNDYPSVEDPAAILMPWPAGAPQYSISDQQIEDIVLTTSAFPTGFGRKRLRYCRSEGFSAEGRTAATPAEEAALAGSGLVCPAGFELAEGVFADGGLFDNLPLGLARILAEEREGADDRALPVSYGYIDPDRLRFEVPEPEVTTACEGDAPPEACRTLDYSFFSEAELLGGFLGTARKFELYRELTSDTWRENLSETAYDLADRLQTDTPDLDCREELPFFEGRPDCAEAVRRSGQFLEIAYDNLRSPIVPPFSAERLQSAGVARDCRSAPEGSKTLYTAVCVIDIPAYRRSLAEGLTGIAAQAGPDTRTMIPDIERSAQSVNNDRIIRVSSLGAPITGQLLGAFGAFLDYKFRDYDYYIGIYDSVLMVSLHQCSLRFSPNEQREQYLTCVDYLGEQLYRFLGVANDPKARYIFALSARQEFGDEGAMRFAYSPMPPEDRDMRIIHEGLNRVMIGGRIDVEEKSGAVFVERDFFDYLKAEGFEPTPVPDGGEPLLAQIIESPESWEYEMTKRWTTRLVELEQEAAQIYEAREPDPEKREQANTTLMGAGAWTLQTATYRYPGFAFAPSTAPKSWLWRNLIPYEVAFDLVDGDLLALWQPTWSRNSKTNFGIRFGFGFAGGLFNNADDADRDDYGTAGLDFTFMTRSTFISSYGFTPAVFHTWEDLEVVDQTTFGLDVHAGFLKNRLRLSLGIRDVDRVENTWFLTLSIADLPGAIYWLSR